MNVIVFFSRQFRFVCCCFFVNLNSFLFFTFEWLFIGSDLCPLLLARDASLLFFFVNKRGEKRCFQVFGRGRSYNTTIASRFNNPYCVPTVGFDLGIDLGESLFSSNLNLYCLFLVSALEVVFFHVVKSRSSFKIIEREKKIVRIGNKERCRE